MANWQRRVFGPVAVWSCLAGGGIAAAPVRVTDVVNPPLIGEAGAPVAENAPVAGAIRVSSSGPQAGRITYRVLDLKVVYTASQLYNPATGNYDKVNLRSYNGTDVSPAAPYVSPTIEIVPS